MQTVLWYQEFLQFYEFLNCEWTYRIFRTIFDTKNATFWHVLWCKRHSDMAICSLFKTLWNLNLLWISLNYLFSDITKHPIICKVLWTQSVKFSRIFVIWNYFRIALSYYFLLSLTFNSLTTYGLNRAPIWHFFYFSGMLEIGTYLDRFRVFLFFSTKTFIFWQVW